MSIYLTSGLLALKVRGSWLAVDRSDRESSPCHLPLVSCVLKPQHPHLEEKSSNSPVTGMFKWYAESLIQGEIYSKLSMKSNALTLFFFFNHLAERVPF